MTLLITPPFTPADDPALAGVLSALVAGCHAALGDAFVGMYLHGSLALGGWDSHSDVDFLAAVAQPPSAVQAAGLRRLHAQLYTLEPDWARHLEGSYIPLAALRHAQGAPRPFLFLENGAQTLVLSPHDDTHVVRWMVRERGVVLAGTDPKPLIDPVDPAALRREVAMKMRRWAAEYHADPAVLANRWDQPYAVLSFCRMLHTLHSGQVMSKPAAVEWACGALDRRWQALIERAWGERAHPSLKKRQPSTSADQAETLAFIRAALAILDSLPNEGHTV